MSASEEARPDKNRNYPIQMLTLDLGFVDDRLCNQGDCHCPGRRRQYSSLHEALQQLDQLWEEFFPAEQARIVQLLVERIEITASGLDIRIKVDGLPGLAREMMARPKMDTAA
jgi:hypothetical protein